MNAKAKALLGPCSGYAPCQTVEELVEAERRRHRADLGADRILQEIEESYRILAPFVLGRRFPG